MSRKRKTRKLEIIERKLGREKAVGLCHLDGSNIIELDERLHGKERLGVLCHELIHNIFPNVTEKEVLRAEKKLMNGLWQDGYRKVDNSKF